MLENTKTKPTQLYRQFSKGGELLYVGVSLSTLTRLSQHKDNSHWFSDIGRIEIENFPTRESAISAETAAIKKEKPKWNVRHNREEAESRVSILKKELLYSVVALRPVYSLGDAAGVLDVAQSTIVRLIDQGKIGFVELPAFREGGKPRIKITGWQLLDYIESIGGFSPVLPPARPAAKAISDQILAKNKT